MKGINGKTYSVVWSEQLLTMVTGSATIVALAMKEGALREFAWNIKQAAHLLNHISELLERKLEEQAEGVKG